MYEERQEQNRKMILIFIGGIALIAALCAVVWIMTKHAEGQITEADKAVVADLPQAEEPRNVALVLDTRASAEKEEDNLAELLADRQVYFAGIEDATINRQTVIYLENMKENDDILMQYEITDKDTGEVLETTGLIPSGEHVDWIPGEKLADGSYTLVFHEKPFYEYKGEYVALTQGNNEVAIRIQ